MIKKKRTWKNIFEKFNNKKKINNYNLKNLLILAGHLKSKTGSFGLNKWKKEISNIKKKINKPNGSILEIGCGSGAVLKSFEKDMKIYGVDYSESMIEISKKALPNGKFICCEANQISFRENKFDAVIIFSSIQYFPNTKYFKDVLNKIQKILKKNSYLYIGEIIEKNKQAQFNNYRKNQLSKKEYKKMYQGKQNSNLKHFSLNRLEVINFLERGFKNVEITNSILRGKEKEVYRFDLCCQKK